MNRKEKQQTTAKNIIPQMILILAALIILDQITKYLAVVYLKDRPSYPIIKNVLVLQYLENRGAAWGMLQNRQWFFWIITVVFLLIILFVIRKIPKTVYYRPLLITLTVLTAGAVGNFIDRVRHSYVVDFIYFEIIHFPIFNVADICVSLSVIALLILILFHYKENDFSFLSKQEQAGG